MDLLTTLGWAEEGEAAVRLVHAEALMANGRAEDARAAIATARARLAERAATIKDRSWRESFLGNVADHKRTLDLAALWNAP
jgi:hypothetical protein